MDIDEETSDEFVGSVKSRFIRKFRHELFDTYQQTDLSNDCTFENWVESLDLESLKEVVGDYLN